MRRVLLALIVVNNNQINIMYIMVARIHVRSHLANLPRPHFTLHGGFVGNPPNWHLFWFEFEDFKVNCQTNAFWTHTAHKSTHRIISHLISPTTTLHVVCSKKGIVSLVHRSLCNHHVEVLSPGSQTGPTFAQSKPPQTMIE